MQNAYSYAANQQSETETWYVLVLGRDLVALIKCLKIERQYSEVFVGYNSENGIQMLKFP